MNERRARGSRAMVCVAGEKNPARSRALRAHPTDLIEYLNMVQNWPIDTKLSARGGFSAGKTCEKHTTVVLYTAKLDYAPHYMLAVLCAVSWDRYFRPGCRGVRPSTLNGSSP